MNRLGAWATFSLSLFVVTGCGSDEPAPNSSSTDSAAVASNQTTVRLHIDGFKKSKSGAT